TASGRCTMPGRQRLVRVVLVDREQPPLAAAPNKNHRTAGAFVVPAGALELREAVGKGAPQVGAGRELGGIEHVVDHVAQHEPACEARGGEGVVLAALGGHAENLSTLTGRRPFSSPRRAARSRQAPMNVPAVLTERLELVAKTRDETVAYLDAMPAEYRKEVSPQWL